MVEDDFGMRHGSVSRRTTPNIGSHAHRHVPETIHSVTAPAMNIAASIVIGFRAGPDDADL